MLPAGLGIVCVSPKALALVEEANCNRCFFDWRDMLKANSAGFFPYTPALSLLFGLRESLDCLLEEGLENVFDRHHRLAEGVRAAVGAWGLQTCSKRPESSSDSVTGVMVPAEVDGAEVVEVAFRRYNLALGAGLARLAGKLFRIGHMGALNELMLLGAIGGAEMAMKDVGIDISLGSGVTAAQECYHRSASTSARAASTVDGSFA
jgi:alanine-glyoxylate transaminase/serine-glyoxylate transaminase/serine-pyruvate transaminase